ncbi:leucyl aminopeptidase [Tundrisphaera lichenicola]|uniref:leucyl aminopeptidase n=1 Tax=Tundrisphaera lichenicola TaxID=2029860 RepID=UPI003EC13448
MMKVQVTRDPLQMVSADVLAIGLFDGDDAWPVALTGTSLAELLGRLIESKDLSRSVGDLSMLLGFSDNNFGTRSIITYGLGAQDKYDGGAAFAAGVALGKKLASRPRDHVAVSIPDSGDPSALVEGLIVGTRAADLRKTETSRHPFGALTIVGSSVTPKELDSAVSRGVVVGNAVNLARDLVNTPPAEKSPLTLAERAREVGKSVGLGVTVWDAARIKAERFGGLLGVASGSDEPPTFVILEYRKGGELPTVALVGKGVTFDSGGLSLKPSASMEDMKSDMTGAAVVLSTMSAIAQLGLEVNVVGYLALTENMINGRAMRLGDVLSMRNGRTVEVLNTDAEGRLILADALSYAAEQKPSIILDLATLTGACMVALGTKVAGLFSNDDSFTDTLIRASQASGERVWRMPLDDDYREMLKSNVADLKNVGGKWAGAITAAKFLQEFVDNRPWIHLDIAGPSWIDSENANRDAGGTGCFVRTLVRWIEEAHRS